MVSWGFKLPRHDIGIVLVSIIGERLDLSTTLHLLTLTLFERNSLKQVLM